MKQVSGGSLISGGIIGWPLPTGPSGRRTDERPVRHRLGVITDDALTARMAGPGIRVWEVANALAGHNDVRLVTTSRRSELSSPRFEIQAGTKAAIKDLERWADVLVVQGAVMSRNPVLRSTRKVVVVDLYDPLHIEQLELVRDEASAERWAAVSSATAELNAQLVRGDYFLCASAKQRHLWLGQLSALGRLNPRTYDQDETLQSLVAIVPFGLPGQPPRRGEAALRGVIPGIGEGDDVLLWGGGVYNWFDPLTLVRAVEGLRHRREKVRLFFMGLGHPNPEVPGMGMAADTRRLAHELDLVGTHVFFNEGWVPYEQRGSYLLEADVGVSTHLNHLETAFSFRTRILDYLWAGLPVVTTEGDSLADLVAREGLGRSVPFGDVAALEQALFELLSDESLRRSCQERAAAVRPSFTWSEVLKPLLEFCRQPRRAPDLAEPSLVSPLRRPRGVPAALWPGWGRDVKNTVAYLRAGDTAHLATKVRSRLGRYVSTRP